MKTEKTIGIDEWEDSKGRMRWTVWELRRKWFGLGREYKHDLMTCPDKQVAQGVMDAKRKKWANYEIVEKYEWNNMGGGKGKQGIGAP